MQTKEILSSRNSKRKKRKKKGKSIVLCVDLVYLTQELRSYCVHLSNEYATIDLLAILQKSLDGALFLYNFIHDRSSGVRGSLTIMQIRKFFKVHHNIVRFRFFFRIAKRSIVMASAGLLNHVNKIRKTEL